MNHAYPNSQTAVGDVARSLIVDSGAIHNSLVEIRERIMKIADSLHGGEPRGLSDKASAPEPVPYLRRNMDRTQDAIAQIEKELLRLESRL